MSEPESDPIEEINKIIGPKRLLDVWRTHEARILLSVILVLAAITITGICWKTWKLDVPLAQKVEQEQAISFKRDWFVAKLQEIEGLKRQIKTAREALASIEEQRKATWVSRESDREIYNRTLERLMSLEDGLLTCVKDYNTAISVANPGDIAGLCSATAN